MQFYVESWRAWIDRPNVPILSEVCGNEVVFSSEHLGLPAPEQVPKSQKRRLSAFAKIVLSQIEQVPGAESIPTVFSTRHGDLPKTVELLKSVAVKEDLSPTQFALSVHNAVSGQFGIYYKNSQPSNIVSAGKDSFLMGLVDALARLKTLDLNEILLVHGDMPLPSPYEAFADEAQMAHCVVIKLVRHPSNIACHLTRTNNTVPSGEWSRLPQAVQAISIFSGTKSYDYLSSQTCWEFNCE